MEKLNAYIVMTNGAINIVTTDPNVADQAKMKSPGSVVKRFPLTSKMAGASGLVGEALDGDFEMGADDDSSIGQDDVEFATDDQPQDDVSMDDGEEVPMDGGEGGDDDTADVICMNTELAVRVFEYIAQNQIEGEELQALADKMADLGNQSDDVLTGEHFDEITGGDDQVMDDEFGSDDGEIDPMSDDGMTDQSDEHGNDDIAADLELGEDAFDDMDLHGRSGMSDDMESELDFDNSESRVTDADEQLIAQFVAGQISREELIDGLSHGSQDEYAPRSDTDPYGDDVSGAFDDEVDFDDDLEEDMQQPQGTQQAQGTQQQQQQTPAQNPAQFDGAYMNGYNTAKRGGQAQQQNINTPQGSAYNRGFMDAKANKPSVPPSKQQTESTRRPVREGVETFGAYLAAMEKNVDRTVAPTIASLFKAKKQKATEAEKHFDIEQDPKTSAVKVTNTPTVVPKR